MVGLPYTLASYCISDNVYELRDARCDRSIALLGSLVNLFPEITRFLSPKSQGWVSLLFWHISCVCVGLIHQAAVSAYRNQALGWSRCRMVYFQTPKLVPRRISTLFFRFIYCEMLHTSPMCRWEGRTIRVLMFFCHLMFRQLGVVGKCRTTVDQIFPAKNKQTTNPQVKFRDGHVKHVR